MKLALCIGLNYAGTNHALSGCIADVERMGVFLADRGFQVTKVTDQYKTLSSSDIIHAILAFVQKVNTVAQDHKVVIYYSGHGSYVKDWSGDEADQKDEVICSSNGIVTDDQLYQCIKQFKKGTRIFAVFDCCHSGTMLDLKYVDGKVDNRKCTITNEVCAISGCKDSELSTEVTTRQGERGGVLTMSFIDIFNPSMDVTRFVNLLRWKVKEYNQAPTYTHTFIRPYNLDHFF